ncbi:hypothetical protein [Streptomyces sp. MP131-18]|uniref:hypothetical protein n=1 Tax=Streptomyces sp. MP131-18 TaxID=1857892 RepID=UPI0009C9850A|nr:hypothetical protein [Streptomyces sp. MP131-18]ONK14272.1 hypothetical protein STBA_50550 [Streptomyces sp. MP131-18]
MSHNQPGPYGQQPPQGPPPGQPGPYGAQPPQGPPPGGGPYGQGGAPGGPPPGGGYGFPQQPGQPAPPHGAPGVPGQPGPPPGAPGGYGQPQPPGPYGQQPPQGPPPYGQGPPPGGGAPGGGKNKTTLVVIAVVAALAVIGGGAFFLLGGDDEGGATGAPSDDGTAYTLSLPETSGDFQRAPDQGGMQMPDEQEQAELGLSGMEGDSGTYATFQPEDIPPPGSVVSIVGGMWGEVPDPEAGVDALFALAAEEASGDTEMELVDSPSNFSDDQAYVKCQAARGLENDPDLGYRAEASVCVWADYSTMGIVILTPTPDLPADFDPNATEMPELSAPEPIGLEESADITKEFRTNSLQEA